MFVSFLWYWGPKAAVALALIVIVSIASLSVLLSANASTRRALNKQEAQNASADLVAAWHTDTLNEETIAFIFDINTADITRTAAGYYTFSLPKSGYTVNTTLAASTLTVTVTDGTREITSAVFTKPSTSPSQ